MSATHNPPAMLIPRLFLRTAVVVAALLPVFANAADSFELLEFAVEGNSVLPAIEIERAVYPSLGPGRTLADIEKARAALEAAYQAAGYLSVSVMLPSQPLAGGVIRLVVVEGEVERLKVSGNRYTSRSQLRSEVPELAPGSVPHFPTMQAELAQAGRSPDRRVTPLLRPGARPGTMEVELAVEDELPVHGSLEINNRRSPDTERLRLEAGVRYTNLFQKQHAAGLNYVVAPEDPDQVSVLAAFYSLPLGRDTSLSAFAQYSNSNIAAALGTNVVGKGSTLGVRYSLSLPQPGGWPAFFHSLSLGADYKNLEETQNALGADSKDTPLRYLPLVAQYTFGHYGESAELSGNLGLVVNTGSHSRDIDCQGLRLDQFECRRANARPGFSVVRGDIGYTGRWSGWEGFARVDFQLAGQALVSPEQMLLGGVDSVRGYLAGEAAGDAGWRLRGELRTPGLFDVAGSGLRALLFVDHGRVWLNDALPGQEDRFTLTSAGVGLSLKGRPGGPLFALDLAQTLRDGPRTGSGAQRAHFRFGYEF